MHNVIQITSLAAFLAMCSACTQAETSSHSPSEHSESHSDEHHQSETKSQSDTAKTTHPDKAVVSETRSAESHTHGDASLAIVLDGSMLTVELDTPLYNVLGFEHEAETATQKAALLKAETVLTRGGPLFVFNSEAGCSIIRDTISVELEHHEDEDHDDEDHDDHEDDEHEDDDHEDDHEDEESHDETHKDVVLQYDYKCQSPTALKNVTVNLFEHFENLTELDLVYLGPNTQKQSELSAAKPRMNLTR